MDVFFFIVWQGQGKYVPLHSQFRNDVAKEENSGRLAQLVQSICLTSRGSAVRIRQRPHTEAMSSIAFFCLI